MHNRSTHIEREVGGEGDAHDVEVVVLEERPDLLARDGPQAVGHLCVGSRLKLGCVFVVCS